MNIVRSAVAGTLESSDAMVVVEPWSPGTKVEIESVVLEEYGDRIRQVVDGLLRELHVTGARIQITDRGALDCVISARLETALHRAREVQS
ncbi:MAG: citrate lyase acyl carrier protein [Clostridium sp.]|nr:citrate lyase acyl carrier protein [Clostridium sp.]